MLCIRSGLASCDPHDFFKNTREKAGFKAGNEPCFAFGVVWHAATSMISSKTLGNMQVKHRKRVMLRIRSCLASCNQHDFFNNTKENPGFKTGN